MFGTKSKALVVLAWIFIVIMAVLPFHAVLSTWAISNFGYDQLFKAWKEILLFGVAVPIAGCLALSDENIRKQILKSRVNQLITAFVFLNFILVLLGDNTPKAELVGILFNLRFFAMFIVAQVLILKFANDSFRELILRVIFWGGVVVVAFGALQVLVLPHDFLRHFGYSKNIIPSYFTVDNNENYIRILSTLRGPNALGAYLVFWLPILALVTKRMWNVATKYRIYAAIIWVMAMVTLFGSRSRSAWLGVLIAMSIWILLQLNAMWRKRLIVAGLAGFVVLGIALAVNWNSTLVQTSLLHRDPNETNQVDSDNQRQSSISQAITTIKEHPFGIGVGGTNIASTYGNNPKTVENYYLQIADELGVIGLMIFVAILILVARALWLRRSEDITAALLAGFAGLLLVNLLLPAWGDETLSMLWWGMAGLVIFTKISTKHTKSAKV